MATKPPALKKARVLSDLPHLGLANSQVISDTPENIEAMVKAYQADDNADAVAYAENLAASPQA